MSNFELLRTGIFEFSHWNPIRKNFRLHGNNWTERIIVEAFKNLARYRSENNFVTLSK